MYFLNNWFQILKWKKIRSNESQSIVWKPSFHVVLHILKVQKKVKKIALSRATRYTIKKSILKNTYGYLV